MSEQTDLGPFFHGFSKLSREERFQRLIDMNALSRSSVDFLLSGAIKHPELADKCIENSIGYFQLPLGVATYFKVDNKDYVIPLAVEETSIIAALSKTAKWIREHGSISTDLSDQGIIGQIQFAVLKDVPRFQSLFEQHAKSWIDKANREVVPSMVERGGGVLDMTLRLLTRPDGQTMGVIHLTLDSCDAMGANAINQVLEYLKNPIETCTQEKVSMCILSNLNDQKLTTATVRITDIDDSLGEKIQEASIFAEIDPYRAATHNKGIMNGIDALAIATGNDWRAIEAGVHAYAVQEGQYRALSRWRYKDHVLTGTLTAPLVVGTVGGVTALHPTAQLCLAMLNITSANELSRLMAAVGLVQNLGAIRALCTEGIIKGHMKLHIDNIIMVSGATESEQPLLKAYLMSHLERAKRVSLSHARQFLNQLREVEVASP